MERRINALKGITLTQKGTAPLASVSFTAPLLHGNFAEFSTETDIPIISNIGPWKSRSLAQ